MDSLPSIPSEASVLPEGCQQLGGLGASALDAAALRPWTSNDQPLDLLLVLAATRTAEHEGISAAGSTVASRRYTALADAELLIHGSGLDSAVGPCRRCPLGSPPPCSAMLRRDA
jgi:NaMN:DMB phosphoribosyltransferase